MKKILIICSKKFYSNIPNIKQQLEDHFEIYLPNCYEDPSTESRYAALGQSEHQQFKAAMYKKSEETIKEMDAVLVLNFDKDDLKNYIGGATFLEMYDAFRLGKDIYMYNDIPEGILKDEIIGFNPIIINGNLKEIK